MNIRKNREISLSRENIEWFVEYIEDKLDGLGTEGDNIRMKYNIGLISFMEMVKLTKKLDIDRLEERISETMCMM